MPRKIRPADWDRLFAPNAPRRGGPLRALANVLITLVVLGLIAGGATYVARYRQDQFANAVATATVSAATAYPAQTATAQVRLGATATIIAESTAAAVAAQATAVPASTLSASVFNGGNVREQPVDGAVPDQIDAGETVQLLAKNADSSWYQITNIRNVTGWVSVTLLTIDPNVANQTPIAP